MTGVERVFQRQGSRKSLEEKRGPLRSVLSQPHEEDGGVRKRSKDLERLLEGSEMIIFQGEGGNSNLNVYSHLENPLARRLADDNPKDNKE